MHCYRCIYGFMIGDWEHIHTHTHTHIYIYIYIYIYIPLMCADLVSPFNLSKLDREGCKTYVISWEWISLEIFRSMPYLILDILKWTQTSCKCRHHYLNIGPIHPRGTTSLCPLAQLWLHEVIYVSFTIVDEDMGHFKHEKNKWTGIYQSFCPSVPLTETWFGHWHFSEQWVAWQNILECIKCLWLVYLSMLVIEQLRNNIEVVIVIYWHKTGWI